MHAYLTRRSVLAAVTTVLVACGGGGGGGGAEPSGSALTGSAVKGPLANALAQVYAIDAQNSELQGALIATGTTNARAEFSGINLDPDNAPYLLVVTADADTIDISTGAAPVISRLSSVISAEALTNQAPVYATPLTTMAVEVVASQTTTTSENLNAQLNNAQNQVKTTLGFGLDSSLDIFSAAPLLTEVTDTPEEQRAVAEYRLAIEALSAVAVSVAADANANDAGEALTALAQDLADGQLDGMADNTMLTELDGFDITELDSLDVSTLTVPGTTTLVNNVEELLQLDLVDTGVEQTLDSSVDVEGEAPERVADTDLDGVGDDSDNCPLIANQDQQDGNNNGIGKVCDAAPLIAAPLSAQMLEDGSIEIDLSQGASDADGDALSYIVDGVVLASNVYRFSPEANENGERVINYAVSDDDNFTLGSVTVSIAPQNDEGTVLVSGTAQQGQSLSAEVRDDIDGLSGTNISYQWRAGDTPISGATNKVFNLAQAQVGQTISVVASYTDDEGFSETIASAPSTPIADVNDAPSGELALVGVAREDETVSVDASGLSDPDGAIQVLSYQWLSNGQPVPGGDSASLVIPAELVGASLSVQVSFADSVFIDEVLTRTLSFSTNVGNANDPAIGSVVISSATPTEDEALQVSVENVQDADGLTNPQYRYQWLADGAVITGANSASFTPLQAQVGTALAVNVSFEDDFGSTETLSSSDTALVTNVNDLPQGSVSITGSAVVGQTLTAGNNLSDEDGLGAVSYQWRVNGADTLVSSLTYTVREADVGAEITVVARYQDGFGEAESVSSSGLIAQSASGAELNTLVGSWILKAGGSGLYDQTVLTFTETGEFFFFNIDSDGDDSCRQTGYEYGTYQRIGSAINLTRQLDSDGCVGLFDATEGQSALTLDINSESSTSILLEYNNPADLAGTKLLSNADSIVGAWHSIDVIEGKTLSNLLLLLGNGHIYSMDADVTDPDENDFFYGYYSYNNNTFSRTWVFQGFPDNVTTSANNVQVSAERLSFSASEYLNRVLPDKGNVSAPLAFTQAELDRSFNWFITLFEPDDCGDSWLFEEMGFDSSTYYLYACGSNGGSEVDKDYAVLSSGVVSLLEAGEYLYRRSFSPELQAYSICWADSEQAALSCPEDQQSWAFLSSEGAQAYVDERNAGSQELPAGTIELDWVETITAYSQGTSHTDAGSGGTMQCDSGRNKRVGDAETYKLRLTRNSDTVSVVDYTEPNDPDNFTMSFDASLGRLSVLDSEFEQDPTGQEGDIYTNQYEGAGSAVWNTLTSRFEGELSSATTLSWELDDRQSVCNETVSIQASVTKGDIDAFLN